MNSQQSPLGNHQIRRSERPGGQVLGADEALDEGHGDTHWAVEAANLPGSGAARIPACPAPLRPG